MPIKRLGKKVELPRTLSRCICPPKTERQRQKPVIDGVRNKKKREKQEVQNTLTLKSGGKSCTRESQ